MGSAIFGYARFGSIVFGTYGVEIGPVVPTIHDIIVVGRAEIRRVVMAQAMIHSDVDLVGQIRTKVGTIIER